MHVRERTQPLVTHEEHVHELSVVGHQRGPLPSQPLGVVDVQLQHRPRFACLHGRRHRERPEDARPIGCVYAAPPGPSTPQDRSEHSAAESRRDGRPETSLRVGHLAGGQHALADRGTDYRHSPDEQEQHGSDQRHRHRAVHLKAALRDRVHRHEYRALTRRPCDADVDTV